MPTRKIILKSIFLINVFMSSKHTQVAINSSMSAIGAVTLTPMSACNIEHPDAAQSGTVEDNVKLSEASAFKNLGVENDNVPSIKEGFFQGQQTETTKIETTTVQTEQCLNDVNRFIISPPKLKSAVEHTEMTLSTNEKQESDRSSTSRVEPIVTNTLSADFKRKASAINEEQKQYTNKKKRTVLPQSLLAQVTSFIHDNRDLIKKTDVLPGDKARSNAKNLAKQDVSGLLDDSVKLEEPGFDDGNGHVPDVSAVFGKKFDRDYNKIGRNRKMHRKKESKTWHERNQRPNYFIAVQVKNPQIHRRFEEIQSYILSQDGSLKGAMIPVATLHITLMVMNLDSSETMDKAKAALDCAKENLVEMSKEAGSTEEDKIVLDIEGLNSFGKEVLFAKVRDGDALDRLYKVAACVCKCFADKEIGATDKRGLTPHLTLLKLSKLKKEKSTDCDSA